MSSSSPEFDPSTPPMLGAFNDDNDSSFPITDDNDAEDEQYTIQRHKKRMSIIATHSERQTQAEHVFLQKIQSLTVQLEKSRAKQREQSADLEDAEYRVQQLESQVSQLTDDVRHCKRVISDLEYELHRANNKATKVDIGATGSFTDKLKIFQAKITQSTLEHERHGILPVTKRASMGNIHATSQGSSASHTEAPLDSTSIHSSNDAQQEQEQDPDQLPLPDTKHEETLSSPAEPQAVATSELVKSPSVAPSVDQDDDEDEQAPPPPPKPRSQTITVNPVVKGDESTDGDDVNNSVEIDRLQQHIHELEANVAERNAIITRLQSDIEQLQYSSHEVTTSYESQLVSLKESIDQVEKQYTETQSLLAAERESYRNERDTWAAEESKLTTTIETHESKILSLQQQNQHLNDRFNELDSMVDQYKQQIRELQQQQQQLQEQVTQQQQQQQKPVTPDVPEQQQQPVSQGPPPVEPAYTPEPLQVEEEEQDDEDEEVLPPPSTPRALPPKLTVNTTPTTGYPARPTLLSPSAYQQQQQQQAVIRQPPNTPQYYRPSDVGLHRGTISFARSPPPIPSSSGSSMGSAAQGPITPRADQGAYVTTPTSVASVPLTPGRTQPEQQVNRGSEPPTVLATAISGATEEEDDGAEIVNQGVLSKLGLDSQGRPYSKRHYFALYTTTTNYSALYPEVYRAAELRWGRSEADYKSYSHGTTVVESFFGSNAIAFLKNQGANGQQLSAMVRPEDVGRLMVMSTIDGRFVMLMARDNESGHVTGAQRAQEWTRSVLLATRKNAVANGYVNDDRDEQILSELGAGIAAQESLGTHPPQTPSKYAPPAHTRTASQSKLPAPKLILNQQTSAPIQPPAIPQTPVHSTIQPSQHQQQLEQQQQQYNSSQGDRGSLSHQHSVIPLSTSNLSGASTPRQSALSTSSTPSTGVIGALSPAHFMTRPNVNSSYFAETNKSSQVKTAHPMAGYLTKFVHSGRDFHRKYFDLQPGGVLRWGDSSSKFKYHESVRSVLRGKDNELKIDSRMMKKHNFNLDLMFSVTTSGKTLFLMAHDESSLNDWVDAIEKCVQEQLR